MKQIDLHAIPVPAPFNPLYRPGLAQAVSAAYNVFCATYQASTQEERKAVCAAISDALRPSFPAIGE